MRIQLLLILLLLAALPASGTEYNVKKSEWLFIPASLPQAKIGGGDFYTLQVEHDGDDGETEVMVVEEGVRFRSTRAGIFNLRLIVNHVTKSSCAGVEVKRYRIEQLSVSVVN